MIFNKYKSRGKYAPVYKTVSMLPRVNKYSFSAVTLGTDTLFGGYDDQECLVQAFVFKLNGSHKKVAQGELFLKDVRDACDSKTG